LGFAEKRATNSALKQETPRPEPGRSNQQGYYTTTVMRVKLKIGGKSKRSQNPQPPQNHPERKKRARNRRLRQPQKSPNDDALRTIWAKAEQVLSQSLHIVFAGFSLHPDDRSIRELLRRAYSAGQTRKVTVVLRHSDPEILERYKAVYGDLVESYNSGWRKYLQELVQSRRGQHRS